MHLSVLFPSTQRTLKSLDHHEKHLFSVPAGFPLPLIAFAVALQQSGFGIYGSPEFTATTKQFNRDLPIMSLPDATGGFHITVGDFARDDTKYRGHEVGASVRIDMSLFNQPFGQFEDGLYPRLVRWLLLVLTVDHDTEIVNSTGLTPGDTIRIRDLVTPLYRSLEEHALLLAERVNVITRLDASEVQAQVNLGDELRKLSESGSLIEHLRSLAGGPKDPACLFAGFARTAGHQGSLF